MLKLNPIFSDHMVFAAGKPVRIFGTGRGKVSVSLCGNSADCISNDNDWLLELPTMEYGGPYEMTVTLNGEKTVFSDIYIGEVILLAGQSNQQFKVRESHKEGHLVTKNNTMRFFMLQRIEDAEDIHPEDGWVTGDSDISSWPLLGSFMALEIAKRRGVAVGLIGCYQGASVIESWLPEEVSERPEFRLPVEVKGNDHTYPDFTAWNVNGRLYGFMFKKIVPYSVSNVIWYQGESDASVAEAAIYDKELAELIKCWREDLRDPALHFTVVQIADYHLNRPGWKEIQEAQLRVPGLVTNTVTVISKDICESDDIHPQSKRALAHRIVDSLEY